ncbi:MAG: hypothetical protein E6K18_03080 [Methanobacteriota archaeon]|nr:MAG: hypothetical protein E6K18_03080 [Euryarchaeota archaeon]
MANSIAVEIPRTSFYTSDVVAGNVVLQTTKEVDTRGLTLDILGQEATEITRQRGKQSVTYRSTASVLGWRIPLQSAGVVPAGVVRFPFQFQIPENALPSYTGRHAKVEYGLTARLDVPWWPDAVSKQPIYVFYSRGSVRTFLEPVRFRSGSQDAQGPQVYVELDGDKYFARELIGCRITLLQLGSQRVRRVYLRLIGGEYARAQSQQETTSSTVAETDIPIDRIRVGEPFAFEIPIPAEIQSSYRGTYSYYSYVLRVGLDIAWASDLVAETPVVIVR